MFGIVSAKAHFYDTTPSIFKDVKSLQLREPELPELKTSIQDVCPNMILHEVILHNNFQTDY